MKSLKRSIIAVGLVMAAGLTTKAADTAGWSFEITPYLWYAGLEGDITVSGQKIDFDKSASDLFDAVEVGGSLRLGAGYDRFVIGALVDYFSLSTDQLDAKDQPAGGRLDSKILLTEVMVGYRVDGWAEGQSFVLGVGARNLHIENEASVTGGGTFSRNNDVTDAMFFLLPSVPVFASSIDGLRFNPVLGIGAGDSDMTYELFPQIQYEVADNIAVRLGYRTVGWKFKGDKNEGNELNVRLSGLILGVGLTF